MEMSVIQDASFLWPLQPLRNEEVQPDSYASHLQIHYIEYLGELLVAQSFHGVELRCFHGRPDTED